MFRFMTRNCRITKPKQLEYLGCWFARLKGGILHVSVANWTTNCLCLSITVIFLFPPASDVNVRFKYIMLRKITLIWPYRISQGAPKRHAFRWQKGVSSFYDEHLVYFSWILVLSDPFLLSKLVEDMQYNFKIKKKSG